ncbi:MAG: hypothetical protein RR744_00550 [Cellulosilyticaceae bacterium]
MNCDAILTLTDELIKKFIINIKQIVSNSDNEIGDIIGEAYLVVYSNYESILQNERVFINELKKKCLRNNKYGKRIESSDRWKYFNQLEESLPKRMDYAYEINVDYIVNLDAIRKHISDDEYSFVLSYYDLGMVKFSEKNNISPNACRQKVHRIKRRILKEMSS